MIERSCCSAHLYTAQKIARASFSSVLLLRFFGEVGILVGANTWQTIP